MAEVNFPESRVDLANQSGSAFCWCKPSPAPVTIETQMAESCNLFQQLFEQIVNRCMEAGLGEHLSVDGSFIQAEGHTSRIPREQLAEAAQVKRTVREYLAELEQENPPPPSSPVPERKAFCWSGQSREESDRAMAEIRTAHGKGEAVTRLTLFPPSGKRVTQLIKEYLAPSGGAEIP